MLDFQQEGAIVSDMSNEHWSKKLQKLGACGEAVAWASQVSSSGAAWDSCERADWLLWLAARTSRRELVVAAACACARTVLHLVPEGEERPRLAIETAEAWTRGEATIDEVRKATDDAYYAADAARGVAPSAHCAATAAWNAAAATDYYAVTPLAAYYAATAVYTDNAAASIARHDAHLSMCKIIRSIIQIPELT